MEGKIHFIHRQMKRVSNLNDDELKRHYETDFSKFY